MLPGRTAALLFSGLLGACAVPTQSPDGLSGSVSGESLQGNDGRVNEGSGELLTIQPYDAPVPLSGPPIMQPANDGSAATPEEASTRQLVPSTLREVPPVEAYGMPPMDRLQVPEQEENP